MKCSHGTIVMMLAILSLLAISVSAQQQPNPQLVEGINAVEATDYEQAVVSLEQAAKAQPENEAAHYYLGLAHFQLQQYPEALQAFRQAEQLAPMRPGIRLYIGRVYAQQGAFDEAIASYQQELSKLAGPQKAETLLALGQAYGQTGQLDQAQEALSQAIYYDPKYVEAFYYYGQVFLSLHRPEDALEQFEKASNILQEWSDMSIRLQRLPVSEQRRQQTTEETMVQEYSRAGAFAQQLGLWPDLNKAIGDTYMAMEEWTKARNAYRQALNQNELGNPNDPDVYVRVGRALLADVKEMFYEKGLLFSAIPMTKNAAEAAEKALKFSADYPPAHELLGEIYALQADTYTSDPDRNIVSHSYEEALEEFEKALEQQPAYVRAMTAMTRTYLDQTKQLAPGSSEAAGAVREAMRLVQRALEFAPQDPELYVQLARAELLQENHQAALETAQYALTLSPTDVEALNTAGLAAYYLNDLPRAIRYFTEAIRNNPEHAQSHTNLGNAFFQTESWYRARRQYKQALEHIPEPRIARTASQRAYMYFMIGLCYHETEDYGQEIKSLNQALALDPTYFSAYRQLGRAYLGQGEYRAARRVLEIATQNAPTDAQIADVHIQIGEVYEVQGDTHKAVAAYSAALEIDPNNPVAASALARLSRT